MDDLTAIRSFRAERDAEPPEAREAVWRSLEERMDAAAAEARTFGEAVAGSHPQVDSPSRRRSFFFRRRRILAFGAAIVAAAVVAGALVLGSGPTAQPASAAEILREAAASASDAQPTSIPGPGQFHFRAEEVLDLEGWISPVPSLGSDTPVETTGAPMKGPKAHNALVATRIESWIGPDGGGRNRETLGKLTFWDKLEEERWKQAGSPLPVPFNPEYRRKYPISYRDALEANSHVIDVKHDDYGSTFKFPDTSKLPTEPKALRGEAEGNELEYTAFNHIGGKREHLDPEETKDELLNVLQEGFPTPQLQAAIFDALAELPVVKVEAGVTDGIGRRGDAIEGRMEGGTRWETIFDPVSGEVLASRGVLVDPTASSGYQEIPAGTVISERVYIEEATVDSIKETGKGAEATASPGGTGPAYR